MIQREIYYSGQLVITRVSGKVSGQELFDYIFWLIDSHNIGEVRTDYDQIVYAGNIESMRIKEEDIHRIVQISTELGQARGKFRTAIIAREPYNLELAGMYQSLAKEADREVELCDGFQDAFAWLGCDNPDPDKYR